MDPHHTRLAHAVRALTGTHAPLTGVHPLTGGTKKAAWRLRLGHRSLIAYLWHPDHDHRDHQAHHPAHIALLQDLGTTSLADLLDNDPHRAHAALDHLRGQLHTLHTHTDHLLTAAH